MSGLGVHPADSCLISPEVGKPRIVHHWRDERREMKQGREKSRRGLSLGGGGCVGVCDHLKPSQEVAGSGRVGGEKGGPGSQGQSGRSVDTPFLLYTVGHFPQNPEGSWQRNGSSGRWRREGPRAWLKCQPTLGGQNSLAETGPGFLRQKKPPWGCRVAAIWGVST